MPISVKNQELNPEEISELAKFFDLLQKFDVQDKKELADKSIEE